MPVELLKLSAAQERDLILQVQEHREEALRARGDFPMRSSDRYRRYLADPGLRPEGPWPGSPKFFVPITRSIFERLHSEIWQAQFGSLHQISLQPFSDEDQVSTDLATRFLRWSLVQPIPFADISSMLIFDALMDSVAVAKVYAQDALWPPPSDDAKRFLRRHVAIDNLDLGMLLVAPDAEGLQYPECRYVHQEFFLNHDSLVRMRRRGFDVPAYDQLGDSQELTERKRIELEREGENVIAFRPKSIPFVESYERFPIDPHEYPDGLEEDVIVSWFPDAERSGESTSSSSQGRIAAVRRLIEVFPQDDRPRRPFFEHTIWPQPRQWRGLNVADRLETMQDLINRLTEQMVNYGEVSMLPFIFANTFMTGELPNLRDVEPGSVVAIDDLNGVQFAPTRSLNRHFAEQIQLAHSNIERDMNITDFNLGRQPDRPNAPRTASATLAILGESRKNFSMLVKHQAGQHERMLSFKFRLWQDILPDNTYVQMFDPEPSALAAAQTATASNLFDRIFAPPPLTDTGRPRRSNYVALPISKEHLSGFFDARLDVNPEEAFDRQVMTQLFQLTAPFLQDFPTGNRIMLKRIWATFDQFGFDHIYPEELALLQTQQRFMAIQVQLATFEQQLAQLSQAEAQQQLQNLETQGQNQLSLFQSGQNQVNPQFLSAIQNLMASRNGAPTPATQG